MTERKTNRERKLETRGKQREGKKHDARRHRLAQIMSDEPFVDFGFMLHETSGRVTNDSDSSSSSELEIPEDLPMLMPVKTHDGPTVYNLCIKRVSRDIPYKVRLLTDYDLLVDEIKIAIKQHNDRYGTDYRANEVDIKCESAHDK